MNDLNIDKSQVMSNDQQSSNPLVLAQQELEGEEKGAGSVLAFNQFGYERKSEFLRLAVEFWPNLSAICKAVGVARSTVYLHRKSDPAFNKALMEIDQMVCDEMEQTLRTEGMKPKGFLDRMAYLRAHRPELYDRAKVVKIEGYKMGDGERRQRLAGLEGAIDAEVVKSYQDRKQRQEAKRVRADEERARIGDGKSGGAGA